MSNEELDILIANLAEQGEYWTRESLQWAINELHKPTHTTTFLGQRTFAISDANGHKLGYVGNSKQLFSALAAGFGEILEGHRWNFSNSMCSRCGVTLMELHSNPFRTRLLRGRETCV